MPRRGRGTWFGRRPHHRDVPRCIPPAVGRRRSRRLLQTSTQLGAEAGGDLGDVVLGHPLDPAAYLTGREAFKHIELDGLAMDGVEGIEHLVDDDLQLNPRGLAVYGE